MTGAFRQPLEPLASSRVFSHLPRASTHSTSEHEAAFLRLDFLAKRSPLVISWKPLTVLSCNLCQLILSYDGVLKLMTMHQV